MSRQVHAQWMAAHGGAIANTLTDIRGAVANARHSRLSTTAERIVEYQGFPRYRVPAALKD